MFYQSSIKTCFIIMFHDSFRVIDSNVDWNRKCLFIFIVWGSETIYRYRVSWSHSLYLRHSLFCSYRDRLIVSCVTFLVLFYVNSSTLACDMKVYHRKLLINFFCYNALFPCYNFVLLKSLITSALNCSNYLMRVQMVLIKANSKPVPHSELKLCLFLDILNCSSYFRRF